MSFFSFSFLFPSSLFPPLYSLNFHSHFHYYPYYSILPPILHTKEFFQYSTKFSYLTISILSHLHAYLIFIFIIHLVNFQNTHHLFISIISTFIFIIHLHVHFHNSFSFSISPYSFLLLFS